MRFDRRTLGFLGSALALASLAVLGAQLLSAGPDAALPAASAAIAEEPTADAGTLNDGARFVAFARDFREFRSWERHHVEGAMVPTDAPEGPSYVYVNRRAPPDARRWPVGTIVVKAIEAGPLENWVVHAMVKRGLPYNRDGAVGWEYFELRFSEGSEDPTVVWRGPGPPSGHGYAARDHDAGPGEIPLVCNDCHAPAWQSDGVLTRALALR